MNQRSLIKVPEHQRVKITELGGSAQVRNKLKSMGILVGNELELQKKPLFSPLVIITSDTKLAIGRDMARHIFVVDL